MTKNFDFDIDEFLNRPLIAHLSTSSDTGPQHSPVWYLWEEQKIWLVDLQYLDVI